MAFNTIEDALVVDENGVLFWSDSNECCCDEAPGYQTCLELDEAVDLDTTTALIQWSGFTWEENPVMEQCGSCVYEGPPPMQAEAKFRGIYENFFGDLAVHWATGIRGEPDAVFECKRYYPTNPTTELIIFYVNFECPKFIGDVWRIQAGINFSGIAGAGIIVRPIDEFEIPELEFGVPYYSINFQKITPSGTCWQAGGARARCTITLQR